MSTPGRTRRYVPVVGPRLRRLLFFVFGLFALLCVNSVYLAGVTFLEWRDQAVYQDYFYQLMFLGHLGLGLALVPAVIVYGAIHIAKAHDRPNRRAVRVGYALFACSVAVLASGLVLTRGMPLVQVRDPDTRTAAYWIHVAAPLAVAWLFVLHRLAGKRIHWRAGAAGAAASLAFAVPLVWLQSRDPRQADAIGPASGEQYFRPSLARTASGNFIPARSLMMDEYCAECHSDIHETWSYSAHRFASFNNPAYLFSVRNTRSLLLERDGNVQAARFCAGCHDLVPFFSGAFDDPDFDDVGHPTADAGITCSGCHAITHIGSPRGNADYTIEEPLHYPFTYSQSELLRWVNRSLIKAKPAFHKKTFLKPLHRSAEFCGSCHKVHLPVELNRYKWLRGQDHYDSFLLSGVSGHGVASFYYPDHAEPNCNGCHMSLRESEDFGARSHDDSGRLMVHDHQFPSANTAIPHLIGAPAWVNAAHREMLDGALRVDIFGLKEEGRIDGRLLAPLRPELPVLEPGRSYLLEVVVRTLGMGHLFTEGTADSNEVWLEVSATSGAVALGRSGALDPSDGAVDPFSHFLNSYVIDREGRRIDRRNPEDIFTKLYDHQIPPGAADVIHYRFRVPEDATNPVTLEAAVRYRKFDTAFVRMFQGRAFDGNDLPITTLSTDRVTFAVAGGSGAPAPPPRDIEPWVRWNDYGIGLLRKGGAGELRQAEAAFAEVEGLGRGEGALNLARTYLREGRLEEASGALHRAAQATPPAYPWSLTWFTGLVNLQNGYLDEAIANFRNLAETNFSEARARSFDFSRDFRLLNLLAGTLYERARLERGPDRSEERDALLAEAVAWYRRTLVIDPENAAAHYGLAQVHAERGEETLAAQHRTLHATYKPDDNARDRAIGLARRRSAAANFAAEPVAIRDLTSAPGTGAPTP